MPTNRGSVFSETLQEITNTKLEELSKRRSEFETTKAELISRLENETNPLKRLELLSQGVKDSFAMKTTKAGVLLPGQSKNPDLHLELTNLTSFIAQSKYDQSISPQLMRDWEESLLRHLDMQSSKLEYASLYAQLVTEWLSTEKATTDAGEDIDMAEGFEDVGDSVRKDARHGWEKVVFEPAGVDERGLEEYLSRLFGLQDGSKPAKAKALKQLRDSLGQFENTLAAPTQLDSATLTWVIEGLLASDLLTDERREVLKDFLGNQTILAEVADVLNMRLASLSTWSWGERVDLEQHRKITGVYDVLMHEDVLQAIFLHYIGVKWSVFLKGAFREVRDFREAWKSSTRPVPIDDVERREYFFGTEYAHRSNSVHSAREKIYRKHYFTASLMAHDKQKTNFLEGEAEANYSLGPQVPQQRLATVMAKPSYKQMMPLARRAPGAAPMLRMCDTRADLSGPSPHIDFESDDGERESGDRHPMEDKQRLIRLLSAEITINTKLHGELTAFHSVFDSWNALLPHETILTVMAFLGVSETWIAFFTKFLKAPLKFLDDDPAIKPRTRRRGTPASHALSEVFGESILFCLDLAVNQATGGHNLYRMHDDFWFWSPDHDRAKTAWAAVSDFVNATRTYVDFCKSGTVRIARDPSVTLEIDPSLPVGDIRWGFLRLSTQTGKFEIDPAMVDKHILDLKRQLADKRKSIISFIQTWNTFAATFFTSNFGKPANCFGRAHVDAILATHERIQREVFASTPSSPSPLLAGETQPEEPITGVVQYLKHLLRTRFGVSDIPDAYLFFPIELGGLDLRSPFVSILQIREAVVSDPGQMLDTFLEAERDDHAAKKLAFERGSRPAPPWRVGTRPQEGVESFPPLDEYVRYREDVSYGFAYNLAHVFGQLLEVPASGGGRIGVASVGVKVAVEALASMSPHVSNKNITSNWQTMDPYWRWVTQLYGPEAIRRFGGLNMVEPGLLPMGMVSIFRDKRVKWQG